MAHIDLKNEHPGIRGLMVYSPETAAPLNKLADALLWNENNSLTRGERELIGAYVSHLNDCFFCQSVHGAMAAHYMQCDISQVERFKNDFNSTELSNKMKSLLTIAAAVQKGGKFVTSTEIDSAKNNGVTDREIHDTVMIAAAFCMFNRYVDGLATWAPQDQQIYVDRAAMRAGEGYAASIKNLK